MHGRLLASWTTIWFLVGLLATPSVAGEPDAATGDAAISPAGPFACEEYGPPRRVGMVRLPDLVELSGFAASRENPGLLWAHNDSGDGATVYAIAAGGEILGRVNLSGVKAADWEDIAVGLLGGVSSVFVGDIGDNDRRREIKTIYVFPEPKAEPGRPLGEMSIADWRRIDFRFPDGRHNAEGLAVHPDGTIYVVTKNRAAGKAGLYAIPSRPGDSVLVARRVGVLDLALPERRELATAADIHPDGRRLLVRTYNAVFEWRLDAGQPFERIASGRRRLLPFAAEPQGEAIAYDPFGGGFFQASESVLSVPSAIHQVPCRAE